MQFPHALVNMLLELLSLELVGNDAVHAVDLVDHLLPAAPLVLLMYQLVLRSLKQAKLGMPEAANVAKNGAKKSKLAST